VIDVSLLQGLCPKKLKGRNKQRRELSRSLMSESWLPNLQHVGIITPWFGSYMRYNIQNVLDDHINAFERSLQVPDRGYVRT
jgi:hypothetical protein